MHLAGHFAEAEAGVERLADGVLFQRFDLGDGHAVLAEKGQGVLEQGPAEAAALVGGVDGQVGNPADARGGVQASCDVSNQGGAGLESWVEQLGDRSTSTWQPPSGASRVTLVRVHEVGAPCPVEDWLRQNAALESEEARESARVVHFGRTEVARF